MTQNELDELAEGKKWIEELILEASAVKVPVKFEHLKRRIKQLRCFEFHLNEASPSRFKLLQRYFLGAGFICLMLIKSKFSGKKIKTAFSIWDSDIDPHATSDLFNDFLKSNQVISTHEEPFIFVKSNHTHQSFTHAVYTRDPIYDTLALLDISLWDSFLVMMGILKNAFSYLQVSSSCPGTNGLFKEFLIEPLIKCYAKNGMKKFYRTNSNINTQEFWCETIDFNTVWYSINSRSIQFRQTTVGPSLEYPLFYFMYLGTSWTWNQTSADWLKKFYDHRVNIVGPIMFYSASSKLDKKETHAKRKLLIFDVTPFNDEHIRKQHYRKGINFYNENYCTDFIAGIFKALEGQDWEISLKPKRSYHELHSKKYISFLDHLQKTHSYFKVLPPQSNLFDEIQASDLVISIPLSSPFDIAKSMNIPSVYFDPSGDVDFEVMGYVPSDFFYDTVSLKNKVIQLSQKNN